MALQVWLPLNGDLHNQGLNKFNINSTAFSIDNSGKIGKCIKTSTSAGIDLGFNGNWINTGSISFGGWFKFIQSEIASAINGKTYTSSATSATGNLIGNNSYGGISLQWNSNNMYSSGSFSSISVQSYLRTSTNGARATTAFTLPFNTWTHIFLTYNKNDNLLGLWINGELKYTYTQVAFTDARSYNLFINLSSIAGGNGPSAYIPFYCNDIRIYDHCLSKKEIKKISQGLVLHYQLNNSNNILTKYDKQIYTEPDNSQWLHIARHNNPGSSGYFTKTASWETGVYLDSNRWYDVSVVNLLSNFEFMVKQTTTSTATETKYRWIQNINPLQAVYNDVKPALVTRITTTGYTDGTFGGLWKMNSSARLCIANNSSGNWFGAIGSWTAYQNGIPGYPNTTITSGYIDLYVRIDNQFNLVYDSSGYNNNIYSNGSKPIITMENSIKYKNYSNFFSGGRLATLVAASTFMPKDMITVNIWIKTTNSSNRFLSCTESGGFNFEPSSNAVSFPLYISGKGYTRVNGTTLWSNLNDNNWHMITATYDRINTKLYIDGNLDTSTASSYPNIDIGYNSSTPFTLGAEAQTIASPIAGTYVGGLSDCRIYATALSADDIKELYKTSKMISGTTVIPRSLE